MELLTNTLKSNPAEIVLGLGATDMATGNEEVYEELRNVLCADSAVAGQASGYAMDLVMLGTGSGLDEAVNLLESMTKEPRLCAECACIALVMTFHPAESRRSTLVLPKNEPKHRGHRHPH